MNRDGWIRWIGHGSRYSSVVVATVPNGRSENFDDDGDGEDEVLPAMADDDYSAQLSWQAQSKDNLKCVVSPLAVA